MSYQPDIDYTALRHARNVRASKLLLVRLQAAASGFDPDELLALANISTEFPEPDPEPPPPPVPVVKYKPIDVPRPSIQAIKTIVAKHYEVSENEIASNRRTARIATIRQIAWYLTKEFTLASYPQMGHYYNDRDHTTVLHGVGKIERLLKTDLSLRAEIAAIRAKIKEQWSPKMQAAE